MACRPQKPSMKVKSVDRRSPASMGGGEGARTEAPLPRLLVGVPVCTGKLLAARYACAHGMRKQIRVSCRDTPTHLSVRSQLWFLQQACCLINDERRNCVYKDMAVCRNKFVDAQDLLMQAKLSFVLC